MTYKKVDKYEKLTENIIELINDKSKHLKFRDFIRKSSALRNPITDREYNGGNVLNTLIDKVFNNYDAFEYVTFKQAQGEKLKMKKGSKACSVYFYNMLNKENKKGEDEKIPMLKKYNVFNLDCFELTDEQKTKFKTTQKVDKNTVKTENEKIELLKELPALDMSTVTRAFYMPSSDSIHMPSLENFENLDHWHEVFFHELTHWTGHKSRLDRKLKGKTSRAEYSKEELVAELGSFFLCLDLGIEKDIESGAAYLKGYLRQSSNKVIFEAMNQAIKACNYIYNEAKIINA